MEHSKEGHMNHFFQFAYDGATLKNKDKYQAMGIQFADKYCKFDDAIALEFS